MSKDTPEVGDVWEVCGEIGGGFEYLVDNEEWEVIGNIHENADLLENEE